MKEIRINPISKKRVIFSTKRGKRPSDFKDSSINNKRICPFCPGNEDQTPEEVYSLGDEKWEIRVFPNKFPAVDTYEYKIEQNSFFEKNSSYGEHEVIVETNNHNEDFYSMRENSFKKIISTLTNRYRKLQKQKHIRYISIFKNHGKMSGASLMHSHSQIISLSFIPKDVYLELNRGKENYKKYNECIYCQTINQELNINKRIVYKDDLFVVLFPFASDFSYEIMILPLNHEMDFSKINKKEIEALAKIFKNIFDKYKETLGEISFNMIVNSIFESKFNDSYHWHIRIVPRFSNNAGFEIATGLHINSRLPENLTEIFKF